MTQTQQVVSSLGLVLPLLLPQHKRVLPLLGNADAMVVGWERGGTELMLASISSIIIISCAPEGGPGPHLLIRQSTAQDQDHLHTRAQVLV